MRWSLFSEIFTMAWDTLRGNKLRSALTVLGIVIGITSIVGMTSLIRGFDQSFRDLIRGIGPDTIFVAKFSGVSLSLGRQASGSAEAPERHAATTPTRSARRAVDRDRRHHPRRRRLRRRPAARLLPQPAHQAADRLRHDREVVRSRIDLAVEAGRFFTTAEVEHRRKVVVLGQTAFTALFPTEDPIGKVVRVGLEAYEVIGVMAKRPSPGGFNLGAGRLRHHAAHDLPEAVTASARTTSARGQLRSVQISAVPREGVPREQAMRGDRAGHAHPPRPAPRPAERLRPGHAGRDPEGLGSDQPGRVPRARRAVVDRAHGRRHRRDEHHDDQRHRAHARDRRAQGARRAARRDPLAVPPRGRLPHVGRRPARHRSSAAGIGLLRPRRSPGFPVSLPWWSFAIGIGFSAGVGVFFGMVPAIRASRLDPIEALRYE